MFFSRLKKVKVNILFLALTAIFIVALSFCVGCASKEKYSNQTKITFELEGGTYQNCQNLIHYYDFKTTSTRHIVEPAALAKKEFSKEGYTLEGWYKTKIVDGDYVQYTDKWDFVKDSVEGNELTLYAHWRKNVNLAYEVCYKDGDKIEVLGTYDAYDNAPFSDRLNYASKRTGYTFIGWTDQNGNAWDENFKHPGGDTDLTIKVFAQYIQGDFAVVKTPSELKMAKSRNIYLLNDIDFEGGDFTGFGDYAGIFEGNNHTISNFKLTYSAAKDALKADPELNEEGGTLCISLFGLTTNATIKNVTFKNVSINVKTTLSTTKKIIVSPIAVKMTNSQILGVNFTGTVTCTNPTTDLPKGFKQENLVFVTSAAYYKTDSLSTAQAQLTVIVNS